MFDKFRRRRRALSRVADYLRDQEYLHQLVIHSGGTTTGSVTARVIGDLDYAREFKELPTMLRMRLHALRPELARKLSTGGQLEILVRPRTDIRGHAITRKGAIWREPYRIWWIYTANDGPLIGNDTNNLLGLKEYDLEGDDTEAYREAGFFA